MSWVQTSLPDSEWTSVASNETGNKLIAVTLTDSSSGIWISTDSGVTWNENQNVQFDAWTSVATNQEGNVIVVGGINNGNIVTSFDSGLTWVTSVQSDGWSDVCTNSTGSLMFACAGYIVSDIPSSYNSYIYKCTNSSGSVWTTVGAPSLQWSSIACDETGERVIACAYGDFVYISTDSGTTWNEITSIGQDAWQSVSSSYSGEVLVVCNTDYMSHGFVYASTDYGVTWTAPQLNNALDCTAVSGNGNIMYCGDLVSNGPPPYEIFKAYSSNPTVWNITGSGGYDWKGVASDITGNKVVACANGGGVFTYNGLALNLNEPIGMLEYNGIFYVANSGTNQILTVDSSLNPNGVFLETVSPYGIAVDSSGFMYIVNNVANSITKVEIANPINIIPDWSTGFSNPWFIIVVGDYIYVTDQGNDGRVVQVNISDGTIANTDWSNGYNYARGLTFSNETIYVGDTNGVYSIPLATGGSGTIWSQGSYINNAYNMSILGDYMYVAADNVILVYNYPSGTIANPAWQIGFNEIYSVYANGDSVYVSDYADNIIYRFPLYGNIVCFLKGTKILTNNGYIPIEDLEKGYLVRTLNSGFVPIYGIGSRKINHPACNERIKDQLYILKPENYPELTKPLVVTGCHSILVDKLPEDKIEPTRELLNGIFHTEKKYRLPACLDQRSEVYPVKGEHTIYHIALEHEYPSKNYGIYANGELLVESCSQIYLNKM